MPRATVVITTKNRRDELRRALRSTFAQKGPIEVLVIDDGSTDGTSEMVRAEFPSTRVERFEGSRGYVVQRNHAARIASAPVVFSIDDDAAFSSSDVVEQTLAELDDPRIGAVAIPYVEPNRDNRVMQKAPSRDGTWVTDTFVGTAYAVRRDMFLRLGGYREALIHQGEERDFCLRMLSAGHVVRLGNSDVIEHFESPRRDFRRMDFFGRRNDVLFAWHNLPMAYAIPHSITTSARGLWFGIRVGRPWMMLRGLCSGHVACLSQWSDRCALKGSVYRLHRRLKKRGPYPIGRIESDLPPIALVADAGYCE